MNEKKKMKEELLKKQLEQERFLKSQIQVTNKSN